MNKIKCSLLLLIVLFVFLLVPAVSASENKINVMYVGYGENYALKKASTTTEYSEYINFTNVNAYGSSYAASSSLLNAAESGLIEEQDVILCDMLYSPIYDSIEDALKRAHDNGTVFVDIRSENEPEFFDYVYRDSRKNPVRYYYDRMGGSGTGLDYAEKLLICLAKDYANRSDITAEWNVSLINQADWAKVKILYLGHNGCPSLELANQTNRYRDDIEFQVLEAYNEAGDGPGDELKTAASSGLLEEQDILICDNLSSSIYNYDSNLFPDICNAGVYIVNIEPQDHALTWKNFFNYVYAYETNETTSGQFGGPVDYDTTIGYYYDNMGTDTGEEKNNAENLLIYLSKEYGFRPILTEDWNFEDLDEIKIMYLGPEPNDALELAVNNSRYSNLIEFTNIKAYDSNGDPSADLVSAVESGMVEEQDLIFCDRFSSSIYGTLNDTFWQAHTEGAAFVGFNSSGTPFYFDYASDGLADDPICNLYRYMGTDGTVRQKNAEYLLHYLAENYANRPEITNDWDLVHIMYLGYGANSALELAEQTNPYSSGIELLNLNAYNGSSGPSDEVLIAGKSGLLEMQDVVVCDMLSSDIYEALGEYLEKAHSNGTTVIDIYSFDPPSLAPDYVDYAYNGSENNTFCSYFLNMSAETDEGLENAENLLIYLSKTYGKNQDLTGDWSYIESSGSSIPMVGLYYPGSENESFYFEDTSTYLAWYELGAESHRSYDPERPTIGIWFHRTDIQNGYTGVVDALIRDLEDRDCNVIAGFDTFDNITEYYCDGSGTPLVQCMISLKTFRLNYNNPELGIEELKYLNVPVLRGIVAEEVEYVDVADSSRGIPTDQVVRKAISPDMDGIFEYIVVGKSEKNSTTDFYEYVPMPAQVDWITNRSIKWAELKRKENLEKKVAVIYYNYPSGKDNVATASYLDGVTSICKLLEVMKENGYDIDYVPEDSDELLDRLMLQGYNAGSWAEGMLDNLVENREDWGVELVPIETYHKWFETLPEELQTSVIEKWGEPWNESDDADSSPMIWENSSGRYVVLPAVRCGSVWLMPQPARGFFQDEEALYHSSETPPTHQYIAFYMWLNNEFKADAIIHLGTHGTHEWLPGQACGMNRTSEWSPILLGDLPNIYPYIVANVGEGQTAEYRGNALIIDHLTPTMERAGAYAELENLTRLMQEYYGLEMNTQTKVAYQAEIIEEMDSLSLDEELGVNTTDLIAYNTTEFDLFVRDILHQYIEDIEGDYIAYGMHVLSEVPSCNSLDPQEDELTDVIRALLGSGFEANLTNAFYQEYPEGVPENDTKVNNLIWEVIRNGTDVQEAQNLVYGQSDPLVSSDLERGLGYLDSVLEPDNSELFSLIKLIVGEKLKADLEIAFYSNTTGYPEGIPENDTKPDDLLWKVVCENADSEEAQNQLYGLNNSSVTADLEFGVDYKDQILYPHWDELAYMVRSMLGSSFESRVEVAFYSNTTEYPLGIPLTDTKVDRMIREVIVMDSTPEEAQLAIYGTTNDTISEDLLTGLEYKQRLLDSDVELDRILSALDGCYIPPGPGNDPVSRTDAVPTGRNFYGINPELYPSKATWKMGKLLAQELLVDYYEKYGEYPHKVAFSRFGVDFIQDHGTLEAEILYLLGVKPVWDDNGIVQGVELIPEEELLPSYDSSMPGRPRIDIVYVTAGMRDSFPDKIEMVDDAVKLANLAPAGNYPNYVNESTQALYDELYEAYLNETGNATEAAALAKSLSTMRCYAVKDGTYELGVSNLVEASGNWGDEEAIAELYLNTMGYAYGSEMWGYESSELFAHNLADVDASVHSSTSNLYDAFDNDDFFQYFGGLNLAVYYLTGEYPEMYVSDTRDADGAEMVTLQEFLSKNLRSTYFNDKWIEGMMGSGYSGASMFSEFVDNVWGWEVTTDLISDDVWENIYETYIDDPEMQEWFDDNSPGSFQSITGRMLEAARKGYWDCDSGTLESLATSYAESVAENGATCCHHTCGNVLLTEFVEGLVSVPGFSQAMEDATKSGEIDNKDPTTPSELEEEENKSHSGSSTGKAEVVSGSGNQTQADISDVGYGTDTSQPVPDTQKTGDSNYIEGYEMQKESIQKESPYSGMSFSGADIVGVLFVIVSLSAIYIGVRRKKL
ncbi:CobN-like chelatase BtuS for metalloporphyrine salvage [Methanosarcina siciliae T4/M]|uniref:CobN-like chelatase BtuS for metalloporphyrine salvage n=1 Tax=Methanosarcina siciliae T4/M TaxID=1434120 RepID=A0A0E3P8G7_9EURY|nr:cobaltochelatase subunit CobN [Methanosarcina siciliae]AKB30308.1 CobN-like chelatase BtuS for metalloporphyrine salvage [Methanosarcina siciliae T4/M]